MQMATGINNMIHPMKVTPVCFERIDFSHHALPKQACGRFAPGIQKARLLPASAPRPIT
jgi:hypothetical protein